MNDAEVPVSVSGGLLRGHSRCLSDDKVKLTNLWWLSGCESERMLADDFHEVGCVKLCQTFKDF